MTSDGISVQHILEEMYMYIYTLTFRHTEDFPATKILFWPLRGPGSVKWSLGNSFEHLRFPKIHNQLFLKYSQHATDWEEAVALSTSFLSGLGTKTQKT